MLLALSGLGSIAGALLARPVARVIGTSRAVWLVSAVTSPFALLIPLTTKGAGLILLVAGSTVLFAGVLVYNVTVGAFRQAYCPPAILGRVVASMRFVLFGSIPAGALFAGTLASLAGPRAAMWVVTAGMVVPGVILFASPLRGLRELPTSPAVARQ